MSTSEDETRPPEQPASTVTDAVSIYEGGRLTAVAITELLNNEVAVRQLINEYNQTKRDNQELEDEVQRLNVERTGFALQPVLLGANALFNIIGAILIGIGTNMVTARDSPHGAMFILVAGSTISLVSALLPILLPLLIAKQSKGRSDAA